MKREKEPPMGEPALPTDALPCVWMTAGMVAWKLCDRDFDCEHCPLDQALRGGAALLHRAPLPHDDAAWDFPADRRYHKLHSWVGESHEGRVRLGLDAFAVHLLDRVTSIVLPAPDSRIQQGRVAYWIVDDAELIPLCAPVSCTVRAVHHEVQDDPGLVSSTPYGEGWLLEVEGDGDGTRAGLLSAYEMRTRAAAQMQQLHRRVCASVAPDARLGVTMADGGMRITSLRRVLGAARYHRIIHAFLR